MPHMVVLGDQVVWGLMGDYYYLPFSGVVILRLRPREKARVR